MAETPQVYKRITVRDVADRAGVSTSTVSRALSGARAVDPAIKAKVFAIADELGYRPNQIAAALRQNLTRTVGFVVPDITNPYFPSLIEALETHLRELGIVMLLVNSANDATVEAFGVRSLLSRNVDALFISPCHRERSREIIDYAARFTQIIQVDRFANDALPYVGVDQRTAIKELVEMLRARGHSELGFVGSHDEEWPTYNRERVYREVAGAVSGNRVLQCEHTIAAGRAIGKDLPLIWPGVLGIVCANDAVAFGVRDALASAHPDLVDDYMITGFDNTVLAEAGHFTSVEQPIHAVALEAMAVLSSTAARAGDGLRAADDRPAFIELGAEVKFRS